ncbi:MAG: epoxyqueuosine reductase QueH [Lachnospiraceae bacterium]|nr:epoxyqueuosine reductase QueH [Lachnospiraceae bacterium]
MEKINYQLILDKTIEENIKNNIKPGLLLHSCCAPCSSYCIEYLANYFNITLYYYNPNISYKEEYDKRVNELYRLVKEMYGDNIVNIVVGEYEPEKFYEIAKGLEDVPEGGERCFKCYRLRLEKSVKYAKANGFDYVTTTLSISPHKNAQVLNSVGKELADIYDVQYLYSDFKKRNGYKRSIELSQQYNLYRQDYCGCIYSKREADNRRLRLH